MSMNLIYFIGGILFYTTILPIIEQLTSLIIQKLEVPKGKCNLDIIKYNHEAEEIQLSEQPQDTYAIGFEAPPVYEEYYEEDEEE